MRYPFTVVIAFVFAFNVHGAIDSPGSNGKTAKPETVFLLNSGDRKENTTIHFFDKARLESEYFSVIRERDQRAYEYLYASMESLHGGFRDLLSSIQQLQELSDRSQTSTVTVQNFFASVRSYNQVLNLLEDKITTCVLLPNLKADVRKELSGKINMDSLGQHYRDQIEALRNNLAHNHYRLTLPSGALHEQVGTDTDVLKGMQLYSADKLNEMKKQAALLKAMKTEDRNTINQGINTFTRKALETFIDVFGTSERFRTSSDETGRLNAAKALDDVFWARFLIRAIYGIKIGSISVDYQKHIFNLDYLISNVKIGAITLWDENHLREALNLATTAQATLIDKGASSIGSFLRHNSIWITGDTAQNDTKRFIIGLIRMDLEEEIRLGMSGGLKQVRASYRQNYYTSDTEKQRFQNKAKAVFGSGDSKDPEADVATIDAGILRGVIAQCRSVLEQMEVRLEDARKIEDSLAILISGSQTVENREKRFDEL